MRDKTSLVTMVTVPSSPSPASGRTQPRSMPASYSGLCLTLGKKVPKHLFLGKEDKHFQATKAHFILLKKKKRQGGGALFKGAGLPSAMDTGR